MKLALVTAGFRRLGAAIAARLAEDGWALALHGRKIETPDPALAAMLALHKTHEPHRVFLKMNSGMNRLGFAPHRFRSAWTRLNALPQVDEISLMTHFSDADGPKGIAEQMAALRTGVEGGFITRNEARGMLDMEPLEGLDDPIVALNMGTGGGTSNLGSDTSEEEGSPNDF